jgi:hypothetical protein
MEPNVTRKIDDARRALRRQPISSLSELFELNPDEIAEGYRDGFEGLPCGDNHSRAYFHGWRNGMVDSGRAKTDAWSMALAADVRRFGGLAAAVAHHERFYPELKALGIAE